jgi:6-pyruvoyltetrahydropterin/6-carboxytetrahydropterin synthase
MRIRKEFAFQAAHLLPNVRDDHQCRQLHGHSYRVILHVDGDIDSQMGWVMDLAEIKRVFQPLLNRLDHHYLNDILGLENPTMESVAAWIWRELLPSLPQLVEVEIFETSTGSCSFSGPA